MDQTTHRKSLQHIGENMNFSLLQAGQLKFRGMKWFLQGHIAREWQKNESHLDTLNF